MIVCAAPGPNDRRKCGAPERDDQKCNRRYQPSESRVPDFDLSARKDPVYEVNREDDDDDARRDPEDRREKFGECGEEASTQRHQIDRIDNDANGYCRKEDEHIRIVDYRLDLARRDKPHQDPAQQCIDQNEGVQPEQGKSCDGKSAAQGTGPHDRGAPGWIEVLKQLSHFHDTLSIAGYLVPPPAIVAASCKLTADRAATPNDSVRAGC